MRNLFRSTTCAAAVLAFATLSAMAQDEPVKVTIGWTPPDITGVFKTATDFFEKSAAEANQHGFDVEIISRSPATHTAFADQVGIIEDLIQRKVDVIAISPIEVEIIKPVLGKASEAGIPVIIVNLLEPIPGGRAMPAGVVLVVGLVVVGAIDWGTAIESTGMRMVLMLVAAAVIARVAVAVHGGVDAGAPEAPSPDMVGVDRPLTRADAYEAERAMGLTEADFAVTAGRD